ncbi:MAG: carboxypeptidase-like regulatory domain-containing protein [Candidatus Odinarchaeota archaeon]
MIRKKSIIIRLTGLAILMISSTCLSLPIIQPEINKHSLQNSRGFDPATYTGYVRDQSGTPLKGALVRLFSDGYQVSIDYTDGYGYYCVGNDYISLGQMEVSKSGYYTKIISVSSHGGSYNFNLESITNPLIEDFEFETLGSNPQNWKVHELSGYSEVMIIDSKNEGLVINPSSKMVKISQQVYGASPLIDSIKASNFDPTSPILLSFQLVYTTQNNEEDNYGYVKIFSNSVIELLSIQFSSLGIYFTENGELIRTLLKSDFIQGQLYQVDIAMQFDDEFHIGYTIYIDKQLIMYDSVEVNDNVSYLRFGVNAYSLTNLYIDNVYFNQVNVGNVINNYPISVAYPLCRIFAPEVEGVESYYSVGSIFSVDLTFSIAFGASAGYGGFSISIPLASMNLIEDENRFGFMVDHTDQDEIIFIRNDFLIDIKEIILPGESEVYLELITNLEFIQAEFDEMSVIDYQNQYEDSMLYTSGYSKIGEHLTEYDNPNGKIECYVEEASSTFGISVKLTFGKFITISAKVTFSNTIYARTGLWIDRSIAPKFEYGRPEIFLAHLGIQPYIVKSYTEPNPTPKPIPKPPLFPKPPKPPISPD